MAEKPVQIDKGKFDALLQRMIKTPPVTLEQTKKEKAQKRKAAGRTT